jgi:hypothetical protein
VLTGDIDPAYPFLRAYGRVTGVNVEQMGALVLAYVATYHLGSGIRAWLDAELALPEGHHYGPKPTTGVERRGHRSAQALHDHLRSLAEQTKLHGGCGRWLTTAADWRTMIDRAQRVHGNARWAAYKTAELGQKVMGTRWLATDAGHKHSSGPRLALRLLGVADPGDNSAATVAYLEKTTKELAILIGEDDLAQVETSLCDWRSHRQGRHPLGHDVKMLADQVAGLPGAAKAWKASGLCLIS